MSLLASIALASELAILPAEGRILDNIHPNGTLPRTVVAGTSRCRPNYWYHWTRDAALVMDVLISSDQKRKVGWLKQFHLFPLPLN